MPNFLKIADNLDVQPLRVALTHNPHLFGERDQRASAYASPHTAMKDIWVRYNDIRKFADGNLAHFNDEHDPIWYPAYYALPHLKTILFPLMAKVEGERLGGVLITKTPPGGRIDPHIDHGWHAGYYEKFYVPVQTGQGAVFGFPDGEIRATDGEVYWFRNDVPHWVANDSDIDRIAMIVCIKTEKYQGLRA